MNEYSQGIELWSKYKTEFKRALQIGKEKEIKYRTRYETCVITKRHLELLADKEWHKNECKRNY
jgi:hypothetical protein